MIATDKLVFLHLERTGGNFFSEFLSLFIPGTELGYHAPRSRLPARHAHLPVIGFIRNPWDWYVSFYYHKRFRLDLLRQDPALEHLDFASATRALLQLGSDRSPYREVKQGFVNLCPVDPPEESMGVTKAELEAFTDPGIGFYTWMVRRMFSREGSLDDVRFGRFEQLVDEIARLLAERGYDLTQDMSAKLRALENPNPTSHAHYSSYYDDELAALVARQDRFIIERFGYTFERR
ncbi:MAG TPA: hypothetical protein VGC42_04995 [Kofleriaceae bacterium]